LCDHHVEYNCSGLAGNNVVKAPSWAGTEIQPEAVAAAAAAQSGLPAQAAATPQGANQQQQQQQPAQGSGGQQQQGSGFGFGPLSFGTNGVRMNRAGGGGQGAPITFGSNGGSGGQAAPITFGSGGGQAIGVGNMFGFGRR
jgi:hypothetical protein